MKRTALAVTLAIATTTPALAVTAPAVTHGKKTSAMTVGATVVPNVTCKFTTPNFNFEFGVGYIHAPGKVITQQRPLVVTCTKGAKTQITMNTGLYGDKAGAQFGSRSMGSPDGHYLGYELCHDSGCKAVWTPQGYTYVSPTNNPSSLPVWTVIKTGQSQVKQDPYHDAVTVTISF